MYENEVYDEVIEIENETNEVVTSNEEDYAPAPVTAPTEIIIPETTASESHGPNKALVAAAVVGGLFVAKKVAKKIKPKIDEAKAKKAAKKKAEFMEMLIDAGVVQKPAEPAKDEDSKVVDVPAAEIKEAEEPAKETSEKKEEKTEKK